MQRITLLIILLLIAMLSFSCNHDGPVEPITPQLPADGQILLSGNTVSASNATIYVNAIQHSQTAALPVGTLGVVVWKDSVYFIYNDGQDTLFQLNHTSSMLAVAKLLLNIYTSGTTLAKVNNPTDNYHFRTGIDMIPGSGNDYTFVNQKARWAGIEIDGGQQYLLEARDIAPEISVAGAVGIVVGSQVKQNPEVMVQHYVRTYASPLKAMLLAGGNPAYIPQLLNSDAAKSFRPGIADESDIHEEGSIC